MALNSKEQADADKSAKNIAKSLKDSQVSLDAKTADFESVKSKIDQASTRIESARQEKKEIASRVK